jgi:hypothetical protein
MYRRPGNPLPGSFSAPVGFTIDEDVSQRRAALAVAK